MIKFFKFNSTFTDFVPKDYYLPLAFMGKFDWVRVVLDKMKDQPSTNFKVIDRVATEIITKCNPDNLPAVKGILQQSQLHPALAMHFYVLSKVFADGLKIYRPTEKQCDMMQDVEVRLSWEDYRQSYSPLVIETPKGWTVIHYMEDSKTMCVIHNDSFFCASARPEFPMIEDALSKRIIDERFESAETAMPLLYEAKKLDRISVNAALLLSEYPHRVTRDEARIKELKKIKNKGNPRRAMNARLSLLSEPSIIEIEQSIDFFEDDTPSIPSEPQGGSHSTPTPHWRKGYWRAQPYGPNHSLRKPVFIKRVMVNAQFFKGDQKDTTVVYHGRSDANPS